LSLCSTSAGNHWDFLSSFCHEKRRAEMSYILFLPGWLFFLDVLWHGYSSKPLTLRNLSRKVVPNICVQGLRRILLSDSTLPSQWAVSLSSSHSQLCRKFSGSRVSSQASSELGIVGQKQRSHYKHCTLHKDRDSDFLLLFP
jgi:hypothetical protein